MAAYATIGVCRLPVRIEVRADRADASVHHVARRHGIRAGARVVQRDLRECLEEESLSMTPSGVHMAAMAVIGGAAQTHVRPHQQVGTGCP